ncbi:hypothetical protein PO909_030214, partial [Leuciscus waleckii]
MDKITNITLLPQDQLNRLQNEAGRAFLTVDRTMYTSNSDGLRRLVREVVAKRSGDKVTVEISDTDVTVPLAREANIVVTRNGIPCPDALVTAGSPAPSDQTDREATGRDYGDPGEGYGVAIPKQRNLIAGFSPLTRAGESWEMRETGFKPYQTSTGKKLNGNKPRVQEDTEPNRSSGSEDPEDEEIARRSWVNNKKYRSQSNERRSSSHKRENNTLGGI